MLVSDFGILQSIKFFLKGQVFNCREQHTQTDTKGMILYTVIEFHLTFKLSQLLCLSQSLCLNTSLFTNKGSNDVYHVRERDIHTAL